MILLHVLFFFCFVFPHFGLAVLALALVCILIAICIEHIDTILSWPIGLLALYLAYQACVNFPGFVMSVLAAVASLYLIHRHWSRINAAYHWAIDYDDDE